MEWRARLAAPATPLRISVRRGASQASGAPPGAAMEATTSQPAAHFHSLVALRHWSAFFFACGERAATPATALLKT